MKISVLTDPGRVSDLTDWGEVPDMLEGRSQTSGVLLHKGEGGHPECGLWVCTPGHWRCDVTRDEFTYFLDGACTYHHDDGETTEIVPGTAAFFPAGWSGSCRVHRTVRKVYMIG